METSESEVKNNTCDVCAVEVLMLQTNGRGQLTPRLSKTTDLQDLKSLF